MEWKREVRVVKIEEKKDWWTSRGLGRAIAVELGKQGQKVIVNYAGSEAAAHETVDMIKAAGGDAVAIQANCKYYHSSPIHTNQLGQVLSAPFHKTII